MSAPPNFRMNHYQQAIQLVDLSFGDSGKGTMVDYLVRRHEADVVVRFNGGPQAGHNVVLPDGRHHTFSQFGSGSFVPGVRTLLSRFMLIEPYAMLNEAAHLASIGVGDVLSRTVIDERCLVITPPQQIANRLRERARGLQAHGTCGMGVGECMADSIDHPALALHGGDLRDRHGLRRKLEAGLEHKRAALASSRSFATAEELRVLDDPGWIETALEAYTHVASQALIVAPDQAARTLREAACTIYEGAQGVLLDERFGFHPHTTWSKTTFSNADVLCGESKYEGERRRVGVMRTYMTRHGAGPFVTFDEQFRMALPEPHNANAGWQGEFRRGVLDLVMLRYALAACGGLDSLAVTHIDRIRGLPPMVCDAYEIDGEEHTSFTFDASRSLAELETQGQRLANARPRFRPWPTDDARLVVAQIQEALRTPVGYQSSGPTYRDKNEGK